MEPSGQSYVQQVRRLRQLCREADLVPTSCQIVEEIILSRPTPISKSHFSDVYHGHLDRREVAVKDLRLHTDEVLQMRKVPIFHSLRLL